MCVKYCHSNIVKSLCSTYLLIFIVDNMISFVDPNLVAILLANDVLSLFSGTLQVYRDNEIICLAVLNALASTVASGIILIRPHLL